jgi:hypothetical protein
MRSWLLVGVAAIAACAGKRQESKDPSTENTSSTSSTDDTPKWDSSSTTGTTPTTSKPTTPSIHEKPARRTDQYDKEATEVVLKRAARQVKDNCGQTKGDDGKATGPWGKVTIQVMLGPNGHSKGVTVPAPYQGKPVGNCIEKAFTNLTFPPWAGSDTPVDWEVELVDPSAPKK